MSEQWQYCRLRRIFWEQKIILHLLYYVLHVRNRNKKKFKNGKIWNQNLINNRILDLQNDFQLLTNLSKGSILDV